MKTLARTRTRLSSVANAMRLIKVFSDAQYEIGISDLAKQLGLAKSTVHRLAATLIGEGMLEQNEQDGKYRLGLRLFELGAMVRRKMDVTDEAKSYLKSLAEKTGETLHLAVLDHRAVLYINIIESQRAIRMGYKIGTRAPLHCTAVGKALMAFQPQDVIEAVIAHGLPARTSHTITDAQAFRRELATVRARGYALEDEEIEAGLRSIAAAVRNYSGNVVAAIGIAGPAHRVTRKVLFSYASELVQAADAVSQRLGYRPLHAQLAHRRA
jgi:IclR family transcriptional regulator, KDG regulon repressor